MYVLAAFLAAGFVCNLLIRPLAARWFMSDAERATLDARAGAAAVRSSGSFGIGRGGFSAGAALAWAVVGIPILWGIGITVSKAFILFR
jgi:hypothetical protein